MVFPQSIKSNTKKKTAEEEEPNIHNEREISVRNFAAKFKLYIMEEKRYKLEIHSNPCKPRENL